MKRPRLIRGLKITWTVFCGIATVLLIVLWVRSYWRFDSVSGMANASRQVEIFAIRGRLVIGTWTETTIAPWTHRSNAAADSQNTVHILERGENALGFAIIKPSVVVPYYSIVVLTGVFTALPWIRSRYSLRTLLIATTLVAMVLGLIVWLR